MSDFKIWMNGKMVAQAEAVLPVNSAAVFYATNVFEGLRAYWNEARRRALLLPARTTTSTGFRESMKMMRFTVPYSDVDLFEAVREVLSGNQITEDVHMHLVAYVVGRRPRRHHARPGSTSTRASAALAPTRAAASACCVSSLDAHLRQRDPDPPQVRLELPERPPRPLQAKADGYDEPIFLNKQGHVAEGTGATFFMVRKGRLTPPVSAQRHPREHHPHDPHRGPLPRVLGFDVVERDIDRTELYVADEAFFCGSGYEITPITSIDRFPLGDGEIGPVTRAVTTAYMNLVRGVDTRFPEWRTPVYRPVTV